MEMAKAAGVFGLACCSAMSSPSAIAADAGWYAGVGVGQARATPDTGQITSELQLVGFATATMTTLDDRDTSYKFFGGYRFNRNFALEGGYFSLGSISYTATTTGPAGTLAHNTKPQGLNLDAVVIFPVAGKLSAYGRLGVQHTETRNASSGTGAVLLLIPNPNTHETNYKVGVGAQYDLTTSVGLRAEWERYRFNDSTSTGDINVYSAGLLYKF